MWNEKLKRLRKNEKKQTITISIGAGNYDTEIIIDLINQTIQDFRVKYQESSIGFENLACLQPIENRCKMTRAIFLALKFGKVIEKKKENLRFSSLSDANMHFLEEECKNMIRF